jgi:hypothetical protein
MFYVTDQVRKSNGDPIVINTQMPAIVLLNPSQAGSLLTKTNIHDAAHWAIRALVYAMGNYNQKNRYLHRT